MRMIQRATTLGVAVLTMVALFAIPAVAGAEGTLLSRINNSRANAGLPPVQTHGDLTDDARSHTDAMIASGGIYHNPNLAGVTSGWEALGENVGVGSDANQLHDAFMASSGHRANILGDYNYVGIGAKVDDNGHLWATVVFMRKGGATAPTTTTTTVAPNPEPDPQPDQPTTTVANPAPPKSKKAPASVASAPPPDQPVEREMIVRFGRPHFPAAIAI